jgi:hypothetical protein
MCAPEGDDKPGRGDGSVVRGGACGVCSGDGGDGSTVAPLAVTRNDTAAAAAGCGVGNVVRGGASEQ